MSRDALAGASAKEMSVGGTWMCSKVPLMLSLPPMAPRESPICAYTAPRSALAGTPQTFLSEVILSKNSCKVRRISSYLAPVATTLDTEATME